MDAPHIVALRLLVLLAFSVFAACCQAESYAPLRLGYDLPYAGFEDAAGSFGMSDIERLPDSAFRTFDAALNEGYSSSVLWLRVPLPENLRQGQEVWLEITPPFLDSVIVFERRADGWVTHVGGDLLPFSRREVPSPQLVFRLRPEGPSPLYIRIRSESLILLYGNIWQPGDFLEKEHRELPWKGASLGVNALLAVLVFALFLIFRHPALLAISATWAARWLLIVSLGGFGAAYFWPDSPEFGSNLLGLSLLLTFASGFWLIRDLFPHQSGDSCWPYRLLNAGMAVALLATLSIPVGVYSAIAPFTMLLPILVFSLGLWLALSRKPVRALNRWLAFGIALNLLFLIPTLATLWFRLSAHESIHLFWYWATIPSNLIITGVVLFEVRQRYRNWQEAQAQALSESRHAEVELERKVGERTKALRESQEQLATALEEQRRFIGVVSHEFRTPLAVLDSAAVNLMRSPPFDQAELDGRAEQILRNIRHLTRLAENCLGDERLRTHPLQLQAHPVKIIPWMQAFASQHAQHMPLGIDLINAPQIWMLDATLMGIALGNLVDNAQKYANGSVIEARVFSEPGRLCFTIADHGPGISDADKSRVFDRFVRGSGVLQVRGMGLGLNLSRRIAELHGGVLALSDTSGGGCTFMLCLPAGASESSTMTASAE